MKFREYGEVEPITISSETESGLDKKIQEIGEVRDIIDLQFSTAYNHTTLDFLYSALLLVRKE